MNNSSGRLRATLVVLGVCVVGMGSGMGGDPPRGYRFRSPDWAPLMDVGRSFGDVTAGAGGTVRLGEDPMKMVHARGSAAERVEAIELGMVPVADAVPGRRGFVYSPHVPGRRQMVDVRDFRAGVEVLCPVTGRTFVVPDFSQPDVHRRTFGNSAARGAVILNEVVTNLNLGDPGPSSAGSAEAAAAGAGAGLSPSAIRDLALFGRVGSDTIRRRLAGGEGEEGIPFGAWVEGRPGFVFSPFAEEHQLVDAGGIAPGTEVRCPYSGRIFRIPPAPVEVKEADATAEEADTDEAPEALKEGETPGETAPEADASPGNGGRTTEGEGTALDERRRSTGALGERDA